MLGNRTINIKIYGGKQSSFAGSRSWEAVSQGHEAFMLKGWECSAVQCSVVKS
jgi:hypothetical protein